ncbi:MAG: HAD family phosphatase [Chloroflexi bacterium]|nr:HAD family phosphatase [Chloroflexota bacterium]
MPIEAVIFDMDGVLVDSEVYWLLSRQEYARDLGKVWSDADQRLAMGRNTIEWAEVMRERLGLDTSVEMVMEDVIARVIAHYDQRLPLRPGAVEAVHKAASAYKVALASGSPRQIINHVMKLTGLDGVFEAIVYADDMPNGKPAPDVYIETLRRLNVPPERAVGIDFRYRRKWRRWRTVRLSRWKNFRWR